MKNLNTSSYWNQVYQKEKAGKVRKFNQKMDSLFYFRNYRRIFNYIIKLIPDGATVLDLGCGPGLFCRQLKLKKSNCHVVGLDFSDFIINENIKRDQVLGIEYRVFDIRNSLPFKENSYDFVVMTEILEHFEAPGNIIAEAFRILKPGGSCVVVVPEGRYLDKFMTKDNTLGEHVQHWSEEEFKKFLLTYGKEIKITHPSFLHPWQLLAIAKK